MRLRENIAGQHTVSCSRSATVHVSAKVVCAWSCERGICDAFCVQAKSHFVWIVLRYRKCSWNNLRLVSIAPAMLILVWIVCASGLQSLEIGKVEDLLWICDKLALLEFWHVGI